MKKKITSEAKAKSTKGKSKTGAKEMSTQPGGKPVSFIVKGTVRAADSNPLAGLTVRAFDRDLRSEELLGEVITDKNGRYEITYSASQFRRAEKKSANLFIRAYKKRRKLLAESQIIFNAKQVEKVDVVIDCVGQVSLDT